MQDDVYILVQDSWEAGKVLRELVAKKGEKLKEAPDLIIDKKKYKADLIPPGLIVARYFAKQQQEIDEFQTDLDVITQELEALIEEHTGEDGALVDAQTDAGKVTKNNVKKLIDGSKQLSMNDARIVNREDSVNMSESYRIYLDACCLNRPFDDQTQPRIALETQAILTILSQCQSGQWKLITSTALDAELAQTPDVERLKNVKAILRIAKIKIISSQLIEDRSIELVKLGFSGYDATHIASAERSRANIFLSTDDRLIKKNQKYIQLIQVPVNNPVQWLMSITQK